MLVSWLSRVSALYYSFEIQKKIVFETKTDHNQMSNDIDEISFLMANNGLEDKHVESQTEFVNKFAKRSASDFHPRIKRLRKDALVSIDCTKNNGIDQSACEINNLNRAFERFQVSKNNLKEKNAFSFKSTLAINPNGQNNKSTLPVNFAETSNTNSTTTNSMQPSKTLVSILKTPLNFKPNKSDKLKLKEFPKKTVRFANL